MISIPNRLFLAFGLWVLMGFGFQAMAFDNEQSCQNDKRLTLAGVGDVLLHGRLQRRAFSSPKGYRVLWDRLDPWLKSADITYANLEGPTATGLVGGGYPWKDPGKRFDDKVYTSFPSFNYHVSLIDDLKASGVDIVSTVNNHSLDRRRKGVDLTIDALTERKMAYFGTRKEGSDQPFFAITEAKGVKIGWVGCTYSYNGVPASRDQVLHCFDEKETLLKTIRYLDQKLKLNAIIATPHWGSEYRPRANKPDLKLGEDMLKAGATLILGTHPHVVQPWYEANGRYGDKSLIIASTGNFVSNMRKLPRRAGIVAHLELCNAKGSRRWILSRARYTPTLMTFPQNLPTLVPNLWPTGPQGRASLAATKKLIPAQWLSGASQRAATPTPPIAISYPSEQDTQILAGFQGQLFRPGIPKYKQAWQALSP